MSVLRLPFGLPKRPRVRLHELVFICERTARQAALPVQRRYPLGRITEHIYKSPRVRLLLCAWVRLIVCIVPIPGDRLELLLSKRLARGLSSSACVFPLRFGRQAVLLAGLRAKPFAEEFRRS